MKALFIIIKGLSLEANNIYIFLEGESPTLRRLSSFEELSCGNWLEHGFKDLGYVSHIA